VELKGRLFRALSSLRTCQVPGGETLDALWHVHRVSREGSRSLVSGSALQRWLPPEVKGDDGRISSLKLIRWLGLQRLGVDLRAPSCARECAVRWLWDDLDSAGVLAPFKPSERGKFREIAQNLLEEIPDQLERADAWDLEI